MRGYGRIRVRGNGRNRVRGYGRIRVRGYGRAGLRILPPSRPATSRHKVVLGIIPAPGLELGLDSFFRHVERYVRVQLLCSNTHRDPAYTGMHDLPLTLS